MVTRYCVLFTLVLFFSNAVFILWNAIVFGFVMFFLAHMRSHDHYCLFLLGLYKRHSVVGPPNIYILGREREGAREREVKGEIIWLVGPRAGWP